MHRAVEALSNALEKEECDPSRSKLRNVYLLLTSAGASDAAKAYMVVEEITRSCSERDLIKAVAREVRDILVLRCLCEMKHEDHANRDVFIVTVAKAFGQSFSKECRDMISMFTGRSLGGDPDGEVLDPSGIHIWYRVALRDMSGSVLLGIPQRCALVPAGS